MAALKDNIFAALFTNNAPVRKGTSEGINLLLQRLAGPQLQIRGCSLDLLELFFKLLLVPLPHGYGVVNLLLTIHRGNDCLFGSQDTFLTRLAQRRSRVPSRRSTDATAVTTTRTPSAHGGLDTFVNISCRQTPQRSKRTARRSRIGQSRHVRHG
eukprot:scaffold34664_cov240-Amphora_coffeaeformis.AAC.6